MLVSSTHCAVFLKKRPGDELQQRHQVDEAFLLQAQQTQQSPQLVALHATRLHRQTHR